MGVERAAENAAFRRCAAADWVRVERNATGPAACLLANQERIQGPENAPIARVFGLGRYQTRSESTNRSSRAQFRPGPADSAEAAQQSCAKPGSSRQGCLFRWLALQHETQTNTVLRRGRRQRGGLQTSWRRGFLVQHVRRAGLWLAWGRLQKLRFPLCAWFGQRRLGWQARFRCKNRSESKAPKTPPPHGLTGFVAIEVVAKNAGLRGRAAATKTGCWAAVMQGAPDEILPPCKRPMKPGLRVRSCLTPLKAGRRTQSASRAQFKPDSAGFAGFGWA